MPSKSFFLEDFCQKKDSPKNSTAQFKDGLGTFGENFAEPNLTDEEPDVFDYNSRASKEVQQSGFLGAPSNHISELPQTHPLDMRDRAESFEYF